MSLSDRILKSIQHNHLINSADKILIGVSGGGDSVALLHVLNRLQTQIGFQIHVGHINHHLRESADNDQRFVEKLCRTLNVSCTSLSLDLHKKIKQGGSVEEIARTARFKALIKIAKKNHIHAVALGHHQDDLAETVLLRILRGTGLQGLQAILPLRKIDSMVFIRPLLDVRRADIEVFLKKNKIKYRSDPTNQQMHFFRNKIRHQLLPYLKRHYQKNIEQVLANLALTSGEDYEYLRQQALKIFPTLAKKNRTKLSISLVKFQTWPVALKRMILRLAIENVTGHLRSLTLTHLLELEDLISHRPAGSIVDLPHGLAVKKTKTEIIFG